MKSLKSRMGVAFKLVFGRYPSLFQDVNYERYWKKKRTKKKVGKITDFQFERLKVVEEYLDDNKSLKDFGCGEGSFLLTLMKRRDFSKVYGLDISKSSLKHVAKFGVIPLQMDFNEGLSGIPKTDYTIALEILEHVNNSEEILTYLLKTTKDTLIFSVPNTGYIAHRLRLLFGSFPLQWRTNPAEHVRFWTYRDMKWWLRELKIKNTKIRLYEGIPILNKVWPSLFSMGMVVIIEK